MCTPSLKIMTPALLIGAMTLPAMGHEGRRFQIEVRDNQLVAQGVNSLELPVDPAGIRPYDNAIHGHWSNATSTVATSTLPGYDAGFGSDTFLTGQDVFLTLTGVSKWTNVTQNLVDPTAMMDPSLANPMAPVIAGAQVKPGTTLDLQPLDPGEAISLKFGTDVISTDDLGTGNNLTLNIIDDFDGLLALDPTTGIATNPNAPAGSNGFDVDLQYTYTGPAVPLDTIYILESVLSTDASGIASSETVYTIFSPDGNGPIERLHFAALFAEQTVPEPVTGGILAAGLLGMFIRRRTAAV
ncbi:MAG: PEP-CTERM sorting domain-containing protein [Planctomycetota bacterium]